MSRDSSTFTLRNYPDDDALKDPGKYPVTRAFSPDIIPLYGAKVDPSTLVDPASWRGFMGMPIVGGDVNNVYIRGYGSGGPYVASLRAFPSELIFWPQVWSSVKPVSSGPVVIPGGDTTGPYASDGPLQFRPPYTTGSTYSLVANVFKHDPANEHKNLDEYEPTPSFDPKHAGVEEFFSFLSSNSTYTFYNVIVADPTLKHVSATTRLRMFGQRPVSVSFRLNWHEGTSVPPGVQVSLVDDRGKIVVARTPLSPPGEHTNIGWVPCKPQGPSWDWPCWTQLVIPECSFYCSFWTIIIECDNPVIPPNCKWTLKCEDNEIFSPNGMCFDNKPISTESPAFMGCHFTGARPGYSAKLLLCVTWCDGGQPIPPPRIKFRLAMTESLTSPIQHLAVDAHAGSEGWPFYVTKQYPYISDEPNPSPLPTFKSAGPNNWPYAGAPQFVLGQVSLAAKPESK